MASRACEMRPWMMLKAFDHNEGGARPCLALAGCCALNRPFRMFDYQFSGAVLDDSSTSERGVVHVTATINGCSLVLQTENGTGLNSSPSTRTRPLQLTGSNMPGRA